MLRWIGGPIAFVWQVCRASWANVGHGLRPHGLAWAAYLFLYAMLFVAGLVLVLLGFDLADVDRWLDGHSGWFELVGTVILNAFWAALLLGCLFVACWGLYEKLRRLVDRVRPREPVVANGRARGAVKADEVGWGFILAGIVIGYVSAFGVFN